MKTIKAKKLEISEELMKQFLEDQNPLVQDYIRQQKLLEENGIINNRESFKPIYDKMLERIKCHRILRTHCISIL